jgi:photosystem II PsbY protein
MATIATMALLKPAKIVARSAPSTSGSSAAASSVSLRVPTQAKKAVLAVSSTATPAAATALAGAFFSALASSDAALAAQRVADVAAADSGSDNRGQLLLFVVAPAIGWVLYNILQPALNQLNRMRSQAVVAGLGLGAAAAAGMATAPEASAAASAQDLAALAAAAPADDSRGLLLLIVVAPAIGWVLFNILQPALNQLNRMRSD